MLCMGPSGDIWCGFYGGVARIAPSGTVSDTIIRFPFGGADETVRAMAPVAREIWVATSSAVWAVNPATMTARVLPLPSKFYTAIYFDESRREVILGATDEIVTANPQRLLDKHDNESIILAGVREGRHRARIDFAASNKNYKVTLPSDNRDIEIDILPSYFSPSSYLHFCYSLAAKRRGRQPHPSHLATSGPTHSAARHSRRTGHCATAHDRGAETLVPVEPGPEPLRLSLLRDYYHDNT